MKVGVILKHIWENLFTEPMTKKFPKEPVQLPEGFRGRVGYIPENCIMCNMCVLNCPANAIEIKPEEDGKRWTLHYDRCLNCMICVEVCPVEALYNDDKEPFRVVTDRINAIETGKVPMVSCPICGKKVPRPSNTMVKRMMKEVTPRNLLKAAVCPQCKKDHKPEEIDAIIDKILEEGSYPDMDKLLGKEGLE